MKKTDIEIGGEYAYCTDVDQWGQPQGWNPEIRRVKVIALGDEYKFEVSRWGKIRGRAKREETFMKDGELWYRYTLEGTKIEFLDKKQSRASSPKKGETTHVGNNKWIIMPWSEWVEREKARVEQEAEWDRRAKDAKAERVARAERYTKLGLRNASKYDGGHFEAVEHDDGSHRFDANPRAASDLAEAMNTLRLIAERCETLPAAQLIAQQRLDAIRADRPTLAQDDEDKYDD